MEQMEKTICRIAHRADDTVTKILCGTGVIFCFVVVFGFLGLFVSIIYASLTQTSLFITYMVGLVTLAVFAMLVMVFLAIIEAIYIDLQEDSPYYNLIAFVYTYSPLAILASSVGGIAYIALGVNGLCYHIVTTAFPENLIAYTVMAFIMVVVNLIIVKFTLTMVVEWCENRRELATMK